jgi:hypothetical protein
MSSRGVAPTSGTGQVNVIIAGLSVQRAIVNKLSEFFDQSWYDMEDDTDSLEPSLKIKLDQFAARTFCCHQALPYSELLD